MSEKWKLPYGYGHDFDTTLNALMNYPGNKRTYGGGICVYQLGEKNVPVVLFTSFFLKTEF